MSFDQEASPQERYGCNCNKLWLRKAPLESWALSCFKYHLYSWSAFSSTMRKSIIKAPAYICNSNLMNYDGNLVPSWQNLGWVWTLLLFGWSINCCIDSYSKFKLLLLQKYSMGYFLINLKMGLKMDLCEIWLGSEHILKVYQCSSITKSNSSSFILYDYCNGGRTAGYSLKIMPRVAQADQMRWRSGDQRRSAGPECGSYLVLKCIMHMTGASTNPKKLTLKKLWIVWLIVCRLKTFLSCFQTMRFCLKSLCKLCRRQVP